MENNLNHQLDAALQAKWVTRQEVLRKLLRQASPPEPDPRGAHRHKLRGYTPEQYVIINILSTYGHGVTVSEILHEIDMPHANVTRTLDRLEKKGIIHRKRGDEDKRQIIVRLTLEGNKAAKKLSEVKGELERALWGHINDSEKQALLELLNR